MQFAHLADAAVADAVVVVIADVVAIVGVDDDSFIKCQFLC